MKTNHLIALTILALGAVALLAGNTTKIEAKAKLQTPAQRGEYLVKFGDCSACHTPMKMSPQGPVPDLERYLSGHPEDTKLPPPDLKPGPWFAATAGMTAWTGPWGISYAANLTPDQNTGLGIWTEEMFIQAMRTGKHMGAGRPILPPMPWQAASNLSEEDLKAIYAFLQTVKPVRNSVPQPVPPAGEHSFE